MIDRELEEYDAHIFNDRLSSLRTTAIGHTRISMQDTEVFEGPFLLNNSGEITAEMENFDSEVYPSRPTQILTQAQSQEHPVVFERDTPPQTSHAYNRDAAVEYAKKFAFTACSDGFMMLTEKVGVTLRGMPAVKMLSDAKIINDGPGKEHAENADGSPLMLSNGIGLT